MSRRLGPVTTAHVLPPGALTLVPPVRVLTKNVNELTWDITGNVRQEFINKGFGDVIQDTNVQAVQQTKLLATTAAAPVDALHAQQATLNTALNPLVAGRADAVARSTQRPVVPVPPMYGGEGFTDASRARSSIQDYFFPPTFVSQILPVSNAAHDVAIAAALAVPASVPVMSTSIPRLGF